jgi:hypothetical protein
MPAFDITRDLVIDFTIAELLTPAAPDTPLKWLSPHSNLTKCDLEKVKKHGDAALAIRATFWPAAATLDYGLGPSAEILYKLIAAAAVRLTGEPKWRWHRAWRPRFAAKRARQRFKAISHVLGMPPLRFPEPAPLTAPLALSPSRLSFSPVALAATVALFDTLDFDFCRPPVGAAPSVTTGPLPGSPPSRLPTAVVIAPCDTTAPCTARPLATDSVHSLGSPRVEYFNEPFVPLPVVGHRASGAAAPSVASSLPPLTSVSSLPSGVSVVASGEAVAPVLSTFPQ